MNLLTELLPTDLDRTFVESPPLGTVDGDAHTYGDVADRAARFAAALAGRGVRPGDRVVIQVDKSLDALALVLGCLHAVVFIPLNTAYTAAEVGYFVADAEARLVIASPDHAAALRDVLPDVAIVEFDGDRDEAGPARSARQSSLEPVEHPPLDGPGTDPAAMLYTSGTTGRSKGAILTHDSLLSNARVLHDAWAIEPDDTICHTLPIFHVHGLFVAIFPLMLEGAVVRFRPRFDIDDVLAQLPTCSVLMGVPTHYVRLLGDDRFDRELCAHVRLFTSGSAPMTEQVHAEFTARTGRHIVERYGMTETGILTSNTLGEGGQVPGTVGSHWPVTNCGWSTTPALPCPRV
ncbi:MAG: AMP-binding protein [Ilumatobacteraceae bacterium]